MSVTQTPAPARSDLAAATAATRATAAPATTTPAATPAATPATTTPATATGRRHPYRLHGSILTAGAVAWSIAIMAFGPDPSDETLPLVGFAIGSGFFQVGVMFLLRVLWRSQALGSGRLARFFLRAEAVVLSLAMASTTVDALRLSDLTQPGWLLLDLCWPLSMLGMFAIGIRIAIAGRWKGASRYWPMVAESWAVVTVPSLAVGGPGVARVVGAVHLLIGYAVLGQIVARKRGDA